MFSNNNGNDSLDFGGDDIEICSERVTGCEPNIILKDNDMNEKVRLEAFDDGPDEST